MENIMTILKSEIFLIGLFISIIILFILYISNMVKLSKLRKAYDTFMRRLGNGNNIDEMLRAYIQQVEYVENENKKIIENNKQLELNIAGCTQKIGIVRYNAFKDTGSDLSFSLALLNQYNDGVVLNGIYARDNSNIYAKPVKNGTSTYILSEEEKEAIRKAIEG